ncbi:MAG: glycosyltransferase, partial [Burkholderiaceae bacterium]
KDTVRDGLDGYRIPTWMPASGLGTDLSLRHALEIDTYDMYCGHSASFIAVDIEAATKAFVALFESSERRKQMGACGQAHAVQQYDWSVINTKYQRLWAELRAHR